MIAVTNSHRVSIVLAMLAFLAVLLQPDAALAIEFRVGEDVVVDADEVIDDDLYLLGQTVTINGTVNGDVLVHGLKVVLNGSIRGDLTGCGPTFIVDGTIGDDLRVAGMEMNLGPESMIGDDVLAAGLRLSTNPGNVVAGSLFFAGYEAQLAGQVDEDIHVETTNTDVAGQLVPKDQGAEVQPPWVRVRGLVAPLIVGLLLCWFAPAWLTRIQQTIASRPIKTTAIGGMACAAVIITAALTLLFVAFAAAASAYLNLWGFAALVIGLGMLALGLAAAFLTSVAIVLAPIAVAAVLGRSLLNWQLRRPATGTVLPLVIGFVVLALLWSIPYVDFAASIVVLLLGLGALAVLFLKPTRIAS